MAVPQQVLGFGGRPIPGPPAADVTGVSPIQPPSGYPVASSLPQALQSSPAPPVRMAHSFLSTPAPPSMNPESPQPAAAPASFMSPPPSAAPVMPPSVTPAPPTTPPSALPLGSSELKSGPGEDASPAEVGPAEGVEDEVPGVEWDDVGASQPLEKVPLTLVSELSEDGRLRFRWTVDGKKLRGKDRVTVSPQFQVPLGKDTPFRMMIVPKAMGDSKGGGSFRKAKGKGSVQLKCEAELHDEATSSLSFQVAIGDGRSEQAKQCAPCTHNFAQNGVCACKDEWEFRKVVDESTQAFVVCLELLPAV